MARAKWYELDNNAKIVPSTTKGSDTCVFRITCELKEEVNGALLQQALDRTVPDFPHFASVLRKGLFWYYLDSSNIRAVVQRENKPPCAAIYWDGRRRLLYRVNYYRRRINLEMFHVLTDDPGLHHYGCLPDHSEYQQNRKLGGYLGGPSHVLPSDRRYLCCRKGTGNGPARIYPLPCV